jgi:hypothetical protein
MRTPEEHAEATAIIALMRGVVYRESAEDVWATLGSRGAAVRDHFTTTGVDVVVDDTEGYAYLRSQEPGEGEEPLPRLVRRRALTYQVSLLLVLLRKRLVEFETSSSDAKLVLTREHMADLLSVFFADMAASGDEARATDQIDRIIRQVAELGFLRELPGQPGHWEVRRILKAYVDAQTLADFATKLAEYAGISTGVHEQGAGQEADSWDGSKGRASRPVRQGAGARPLGGRSGAIRTDAKDTDD